MSKRIDYRGVTVGFLFVAGKTNESGTSGKIYEAVCKCGVSRRISAGSIRRGIREGYNLSCNTCEYATVIKVEDKTTAAFNSLLSQYKNSAKRRGYLFELTRKEFKSIIKKDCEYCGDEPFQKSKTYNKKDNGEVIYNGVDRVDNSIGYVLTNCVPCCGICNRMKRALTKVEFLNHIDKIYNKRYYD